ncbi:sepiapterin reductase a [Brachionichthys hirsutus]|uniref:sepiapterin reductase a n=1 Tax=Brachionichthys hirsutus TaxID=412623 RepID=UPI0036046DDF
MASPARGRADFGRALCVITGASRGFGRALAKQVSGLVRAGSVLVLAARSADDLQTLRAELTQSGASPPGLVVQCVAADLGSAQGVESVVTTCKAAFTEDIDHVFLINNAGALGDVSRYLKGFTDMTEVNSYLSLNVSSMLCLTASVLQAFPPRPGLRRTAINVSSLTALQPFPSWVLYCTGKAARDMMFRVLAEEQPDVRVLNYAPGPLDTEMLRNAVSRTADPTIKKSFVDLYAKGEVLTCEASSSKLMKLLLEDSFTSGAHVDFYDI